ncbi:hypothetical protein Q1695_013614 [Nippostrongylus brasiliensis]|nr:hypothetical protein Q1695_013614 [Nippostrongylus brasiliensis]
MRTVSVFATVMAVLLATSQANNIPRIMKRQPSDVSEWYPLKDLPAPVFHTIGSDYRPLFRPWKWAHGRR